MYLMESDQEAHRLLLKTNTESVMRQAAWAGISKGMRVLDVGCGSGAATHALAQLVGPTGEVVGLDISSERLDVARQNNDMSWLSFVQHDISNPYHGHRPFDAIWSRFFLEYFKNNQQQIILNSISSLRSGGIICLGDLDHNCLNLYGHNPKIQQSIEEIIKLLQDNHNFDPYAGRRIYSHLYNLGCGDISCMMEAHHLIYGEANDVDLFNWITKVEVAAVRSGCAFTAYEGVFDAFKNDVSEFLKNPARFIYTPLIIVRGVKP